MKEVFFLFSIVLFFIFNDFYSFLAKKRQCIPGFGLMHDSQRNRVDRDAKRGKVDAKREWMNESSRITIHRIHVLNKMSKYREWETGERKTKTLQEGWREWGMKLTTWETREKTTQERDLSEAETHSIGRRRRQEFQWMKADQGRWDNRHERERETSLMDIICISRRLQRGVN